ncbi:virion structural protein [Vibrio phage Aphrodite1]|uniref:Uncharacterized protein n=1 Tax=Vibrio phage Aphrodite1 TaxID=2070057 RepID=A0A2I7QI43_9CAUD|nr:virion structural protein [Vibrio phage Aphrodite1]AUR81066.1 hypothetical protein Aphrodite1_0106 [Vibrio phage Aphrodite1]
MSHLSKVIKLNTVLAEKELAQSPSVQALIVESAMIRASVAYAHAKSGVEGAGLSESVREDIHKAVEKWNEVSPINHRHVINSVGGAIQRLYNQALAGCEFRPIEVGLDELDFNLMELPEYKELFRCLLTELIEDNR